MATYYIDSSVSSSGNGLSWGTAWKALTDAVGVTANDTVYISGGVAGNSQNYDLSTAWSLAIGIAGQPVIYKIGQDALHNGVAVFNYIGGVANTPWLNFNANFVISGDAGDGIPHFKTKGFQTWITGSIVNVTIEYCDGTEDLYTCAASNAATYNFIFRHNHIITHDINGNQAFVLNGDNGGNVGYSVNQISYNLIEPMCAPTGGVGYDAFSAVSNFTFNNNIVNFLTGGFTGTQHSDGWQGGGGSYCALYDNVFIGVPNYCMFAEGGAQADQTMYQHVRIYNNLCFRIPNLANGGGIIMGPGGGFRFITTSVDDVVFANNNFINYDATNAQPISLNTNVGQLVSGVPITGYFTNCYIQNNLFVGSGTLNTSINLFGNTGTTTGYNSFITTIQGSGYFVNYTLTGNSGDNLALTSSAIPLIGSGINLSQFFTTDFSGRMRMPGTGLWDIGAYAYYIFSGQNMLTRMGRHPKFRSYHLFT